MTAAGGDETQPDEMVPGTSPSLRAAARHFGSRRGHFLILLAGGVLAGLVGLALGLAARRFQVVVDVGIYGSLAGVFVPTGWWPALAAFYTQLGNPGPMLVQTLVATVAFAILFGRRWWIPVLLLPVGMASELAVQKTLEYIVARGHPFAGAGTFPSGGSARFVVIYGLIVFLAMVRWPRLRPYWPIGAALVAFLAGLEGWTRLYLLMHWPTDVLGGWIIGSLLLAALVASGVVALEGEAMEGRRQRLESAGWSVGARRSYAAMARRGRPGAAEAEPRGDEAEAADG